MRKLSSAALSVLLLLVFSPSGTNADAFLQYGLEPGACVITDRNVDTFNEAFRLIKRNGGRALDGFPPDIIFGYFPPGFNRSDLGDLSVRIVRSSRDVTALQAGRDYLAVSRDHFHESDPLASSPVPIDTEPLIDLLLRVPEEIVERTRVRGPHRGSPLEIQQRGINQNSEFMIGTTVINLIFPESAGGSEDWTDEEINDAYAGVKRGISNYRQHAHWTDLDFKYNVHRRVPVSREPIEGDISTDHIWMTEALNNMGYGGYMLYAAHELNNESRIQFEMDWAFTAFIVDASANGCWQGPGGFYVAYSYLGGPLLVVPFPACGFGADIGFSHVFIHEMSHTFWTLDEYAAAEVSCDARSGYLNIPTKNSYVNPPQGHCDLPLVPCIMNNAVLSEPLPICKYTLGQVGLADLNFNAKPDIFEVWPEIRFIEVPGGEINPDTIFKNEYAVGAVATLDAIENQNSFQSEEERIDYAPWFVAGEYRLQSSPYWLPINPSTGDWDSSREDIGFFLKGLKPGLNTLSIRVTSNIGYEAVAERDITYIGIEYNNFSAYVHQDSINVSWETAEYVFGATFELMRDDFTAGTGPGAMVSIADTDSVYYDIGSGKRHYKFSDKTVTPGHEYRYWVVGTFQVEINGEPVEITKTSGSISRVTLLPVSSGIVSVVLPNPTTGGACFTIKVPKTFMDPTSSRVVSGPGIYGMPGLIEVKTPLDVGVFNVLGQRVATIRNMSVFGRSLPLKWNGKDRRGRDVPSGVYFLRVKAGNDQTVKKIVIIR